MRASTPVGPLPEGENERTNSDWPGASGLAEDVRRYGHWMREEAFRRIGHYYPEVDLPASEGGSKGTVIAWLWARTVASPDPSLKGKHVPLVSSFWLSKKKGKEAYVEPVVADGEYTFRIRKGKPLDSSTTESGTKTGRGGNFKCIVTGSAIDQKYVRKEAMEGRMDARLLAVVAEGKNKRVYVEALGVDENLAIDPKQFWQPENKMPENPRWFSPPLYGLTKFADLFTPRQLLALNTFSDLVAEARERVAADAVAAGLPDDGVRLEDGSTGAKAYGEAVGVYLGISVNRLVDSSSSLVSWTSQRETLRSTFGRQALPMVWDYAEVNPFSTSTGNYGKCVSWIVEAIKFLPAFGQAKVVQKDASKTDLYEHSVFSTDPPYYDNIGYADLSDFFYIWFQRNLSETYSKEFSTLATPKMDELVATPYRHGGRAAAEEFFMQGMQKVFANVSDFTSSTFPIAIYYAFKQSAAGWETFLRGVISSRLTIVGTWPMRTERGGRMIGNGTNSLASSLVLVCRSRPADAPIATRAEFLRKLRKEMPEALEDMVAGTETSSPIAPVDLAQAAIGPGMAVYSSYAKVFEASGDEMPISKALEHIVEEIDKYFSDAEGQLDAETRFCIDWFQQYTFKEGPFGSANVLASAKGTSVERVADSGVAISGKGHVQLRKPMDYPTDWDPQKDALVPAWEACHQLIRAQQQGGEQAAGTLLARMPQQQDPVNRLAYRLYTLCERNKWSEQARLYNGLVTSWQAIVQASQEKARPSGQATLSL